MKSIGIIILISIFLLTFKNRVEAQPNFTPIEINQLELVSPGAPFTLSPQPLLGHFDFHYTYFNQDTIDWYLNVFVLNPSTQNAKWAIENLILAPFDAQRDLHYQMPLDDIFQPGNLHNNMGLQILITDTMLVNPILPPPTAYDPFNVFPRQIIIGPEGGLFDPIVNLIPADTFSAPGSKWVLTDTSRSLVRSCKVPNLNLDSSKHGPDTSYAGDWNACAPVGCANSMQWLEQVYPGKINSGLSHRDKLKELSKLMKRQARKGVNAENIVKGKLAFVDKYKLPIRVKFQHLWLKDSCIASPDTTYKHQAKNRNKDRANPNKNQLDWAWLWGEMEHGEDVEMWIAKKDIVGDSLYVNHIVTLTDISETKSGVRRLSYKDDKRQGDSTGTQELTFTVDSTNKGYLYFKEGDVRIGGALRSRTFIVGFYSESYDSTIVYTSINEIQSDNGLNLKVFNNPFSEKEQLMVDYISEPNKEWEVSITDIRGRLVWLKNGVTKRNNRLHWNGIDGNGVAVPSGIYIMKLKAGSRSGVIKIQKQ